MWNIEPNLLCNRHLLGEHNEIHKMIGNLRNSRRWAESLTAHGFLEPQNALKRHNLLVKEMKSRGMNHKSPLYVTGVNLPCGRVDIIKSKKDLKSRCKKCHT